jgi:hypothetical protein
LHIERLLADTLLPPSHNIPLLDNVVMEMDFEGTPPPEIAAARKALGLTETHDPEKEPAKGKVDAKGKSLESVSQSVS